MRKPAESEGKVMPEEFLTAQDLHKSFNDHKAVYGVSCTIRKGEMFGPPGTNGAGSAVAARPGGKKASAGGAKGTMGYSNTVCYFPWLAVVLVVSPQDFL